jgi:hypothetical protein
MKIAEFEEVVNKQLTRCEEVLKVKGDEYATYDRLSNFRMAAKLQEITLKQALFGMMAKHTVSLYNLCNSFQEIPMEVWDEKITDHINYLILLKAILMDEQDNEQEEKEDA